MGKAEKKVKRKGPMAAWAVSILKVSGHISMCIAIICMVGVMLLSSVYLEQHGYRTQLYITNDISYSKEVYARNQLYSESYELVRYATIRSQLETEGKFDADKEINVSDYYYRKTESQTPDNLVYFKDAVYTLESLIRWNQSGGREYLEEVLKTPIVVTESQNVVELTVYGTRETQPYFVTVDGLNLRDIVENEAQYRQLCRQLLDCMEDLYNNYQEYLYFTEKYNHAESNFVYYIDMNNKSGDVYTNVHFDDVYSNSGNRINVSQSRLKNYFEGIDYYAKGTTSFAYGVKGDFSLTSDEVGDSMDKFAYALGDDAVVYLGYDLSIGAKDDFAAVWNAYEQYNPNTLYILMAVCGVCVIYYFVILFYAVCASGRKVDQTGGEYIELKWMDAIPLEMYLVWCAAVGFAVAGVGVLGVEKLMRGSSNYISDLAAITIVGITFAFSWISVESLLSLARRIKAHTFWKNSILYKYGVTQLVRFFRFLGKCYRKTERRIHYYMEHSGRWENTWGMFLVEVVFAVVSVICIVLLVADREAGIALMIAFIYLLVVMILAYRRMTRKEERMDIVEKIEGIVSGESCRVDEEQLSVENAALGHAVNEIGEGIQKAVKVSTRDERLKAELLTNVSHDIKTPLTSIITYVDLLKNEKLDNEKAVEYIDILENKSHKLKNLIQDLVEVSKISTGNIEYEMMPLNVHELVMQAAGEYDEKFKEHCLKLVYDNECMDAVIMADSRRMWRVIDNLLTNVYKYALEGTRVYIEVNCNEDKLNLSIKNISAKELNVKAEDLTERFVRGDLSRTTEGSGLGLAIAKNLVVGQGGQFHIFSDGDLFKVIVTFKIHS